ncbi:MAG TPA: branched-chain amino acid ABC transporter permease [Phototrophicaceae bacterium]|jgi:branched-chain amino acid transport system permease protein|nr:branched-chain amino acid ABC transporter permease [Phototrophicaceae bacterium]
MAEVPMNSNLPNRNPLNVLRERLTNDPVAVVLYSVGGLFVLFLVLVSIGNILNGSFTMERFVRLLIFGLAQGSIYALIALGYTLVYGVLLMINFAHGEVFMSGAYIGFFAITAMESHGMLESQPALVLLLTLLVGMLASVTIAFLLERIAYRPLRNAPRLVPLISAIGASITIQQLFLRLFGGGTRVYPNLNLFVAPGIDCTDPAEELCTRGIDLIGGSYKVELLGLNLQIRPLYFIIFFLAIILMSGLWFIVQRTKVGRAMRAVAEDKNTAALMGVNVDRVILITFTLGAALAGAAAVLFALYNSQVTPFMGFTPGIKAFTAAVLGGIGNIPGAMAGGLLLGILESVAPSLLGIQTQLQDVVSFGVLVLILIFRPTGILGEALSKKKA